MGELLQMASTPRNLSDRDYFDDFWTLVWRREKKKEARQAWVKIDARLYPQIVIAVAAWRPIYLGRGDTRFVPLPATWLNGERWDDDIPPEHVTVARPMTVLPEMPRKSGEIPAHVLAQIAKLKGR